MNMYIPFNEHVDVTKPRLVSQPLITMRKSQVSEESNILLQSSMYNGCMLDDIQHDKILLVRLFS